MSWTLHQPFAIVGRDPRADLSLDDFAVSLRHAYLQVIERKLYCIDLDSREGVHWEGGTAQAIGWLSPGHAVGMGPFRLQLVEDGCPTVREASPPPGEWDPLRESPADSASLPQVVLEFKNLKNKRPPWRLKRVLTLVGSSPICGVRLHSSNASRFHASLLRTRQGIWVIDLLTQTGIKVNGKRVRSARLDDNDVLEVGSHLIRVRYLAASEAPGPVVEVAPVEANGAASSPDSSAEPAATFPPLSASSGTEMATSSGALARALPGDLVAPLPFPVRELMPALDGIKMSEPLLLPLLSHFGQMQQQMFDQFHQSMLMMMQMMGALHRDQMEAVREELDRVAAITHELQSLQSELAERSLTTATTPAAGAAPVPPTATALSRPAPPLARNGTEGEGAAGGPVRDRPVPPQAPPVPPSVPGAVPAEDPHEWLNRRIAAIQEERQSRWQKILGFLRGKRSEETRT
jgi:pSer/pThr/pTyr-binding forkhead associated (FHA) protein